MGRAKETFGKKEVRNKKEKKRKDKEKRKLEKKELGKKSFDDMIAWVDENGVITSTQPDLTQKKEIKAENIDVSVPSAKYSNDIKTRFGTIIKYDDSKGFGFIIDKESKESIFVHINDCNFEIKIDNNVKFEIIKGAKGPKAVNVELI